MSTRLARRVLLAAPLLLAARRPDTAGSVRLMPGGDAVDYQFKVMPDATQLGFDGFEQVFTLPGEAAAIGVLPIAGRQVLQVRFSADAFAGVSQKLVAIIGWDGKVPRILGVEVLSFAADQQAIADHLSGRVAATADRTHLRVTYDASRIVHGAHPRRESWMDILAWKDGAPLQEIPRRHVPPTSWQARMTVIRAKVDALLVPPRTLLTTDMLGPTGLLDPLATEQ
jgi:hypothetical protein